jgi:hypothetical protein
MLRAILPALALALLPSVALASPAKQWAKKCMPYARSVMRSAFVPTPIIMPALPPSGVYSPLAGTTELIRYHEQVLAAKNQEGRIRTQIGIQAFEDCMNAKLMDYYNRQRKK